MRWAQHAAGQAQESAGVVVRDLHSAEQMQTAAQVLGEIWAPGGRGETPLEAGLLVALEHAGNYVAGAYSADRLIGVTVGFFGAPDPVSGRSQMMHSHIAGVLPTQVRGGVGAAMKLHQRAWCLERGITTMEWTFDPLIARNARFNLHKLGARLTAYLPNFYGEMRDAVNAGQGSDRALICWDLEAEVQASEPVPHLTLLEPDDDGTPRTSVHGEETVVAAAGTEVAGLRIPVDINQMRTQRPEVSAQWRVALRQTMHPLLTAGWSVRGIGSEGTYLLTNSA
ncbi:hypothetical protein [Nesterenkonia muleiensis]|uniref:hypothetical protein n=1 Tax=Nesterenkonia muleiensis TaxID=2282648 RepID=UPI001EE3E0EA|nr:hypothetical protein [Nesterenkonia muleiensis]